MRYINCFFSNLTLLVGASGL